jgi:LamB porin
VQATRICVALLAFALLVWPAFALAQDEEATEPTTAEATDGDEKSAEPTPVLDQNLGMFKFGSYGRVQVDNDGEGNRGRDANIVAHGPRLFEPSYAEMDFSYHLAAADEFGTKVQFTLAFFEPFAHESGDYDQSFAIRNLYAEAWGFVPYVPWLRVWAGSRMYRGDDIYLLDFWPLDNLNTIGGGLIFDWWDIDVRFHAGVNRLDDDYQFQTIEVPGATFGSREKLVLDRQRYIMSLRAQYELRVWRELGLKFVAYGEQHSLPEGERIPSGLIEDNVPTYQPSTIMATAPEDEGWVAGGQLGVFGFGPQSHVNLFFRWAQDLAAYGETGVPWGTNNDGTAEGAYEMVGALSANYEFKWLGVLAGGYVRKFKDADVNKYDTDDYMEGALAVRPVVFITDHLHQGFEVGYQQHYPFGLDADTGAQEISEVMQYSLLEIVSLGRGSYKRPQFRLTYTLSRPNASARRTYQEGDQRRLKKEDHFIGFGVEWWFNSSTY